MFKIKEETEVLNDEFVLMLMAALDRQKSQKQINADIKSLEQVIRKIKIVGTLAKGNTKQELNQTIRQLESQLKQIKIQAKMDNRQLNREIDSALKNISSKEINLNFNSHSERLNAQIRRTVSQAREYVSRNPLSINIELKKEKLLNQLATFTSKNTKINESSYWLGEAERLRGVIGSVTNRNELRNASDQFQVFTSGVRATGYAAVSTTDRIKGMLGNIVKVGNYFGLAFVAVNKFRESLSTLKANDTILTEISKTSEMTKKQLKELGDESFSTASKYGRLSGDYLTSVQEMARSGYETLSKELGELSLLAQSAGDMTAEMANNYLLATDAAYKYGGSVEKLNAALDGANYISNKNSASLTDIADATRVSASFAANAGVTIDELTAAEATMIATTKRSGSEMGRAFRSILLNLQQVSGEFDGEVIDEEQLEKVEDRCHSLGVELEYMKDGVATLRNPIEVLKDLADVYNSLPDNSADKQGLISDIGGKYHANALSALLSRWDLYEKMIGEFSQGTGSALEEANKTADSWEGRLNSLSNSWTEFVSSLTSKEAVKGGISFLDNTIQAFEKLTDVLGAIPVIMTAVNGSMTALNKNYGITQIFNGDTRKLDVQGNFMGIDITAFKEQKKHFSEAEIAIRDWNNQLVDGIADINTFGCATGESNAQLRAYLRTTSADAPASLNGYRSYLNAAGVSTDALRLKTILLNSVLTMGLSLVIQTVVSGIAKLVNAEKEAVQTAREAADTYKENTSAVGDYVSRYNELREALLAAKGNEEETYNIKKQLLELQTDLNDKFGDEYGKINLLTEAYKNQTEVIKELNKESANRFLNENRRGIETSEKKLETDRTYHIGTMNGIVPSEEFDILKKIKKIADDNGIDFTDRGFQFVVNALEAKESIENFMNQLRELQKESGDVSGTMDGIFDGILDNSGEALSKADKLLDEYGEIYRQAKIAQIASDTELSGTYDKAVTAVKEYNEAVLRSENPYNDENVSRAWEDLQTVRKGIRDNEEEWGQYSMVMDDVFAAANDNVYSFYQTLKNDENLKKYTEQLKGLSDTELQSMADDGNNGDAFDMLNEKAEKCGVETQTLIDLLKELEVVQDNIGSPDTPDTISLSLSDRFKDLWDSESFKDAKENLEKLARESKITADDIISLARENETLSGLLDESGMSAQFAAECFDSMSRGGKGFDAITNDALLLDQVLNGMTASLQHAKAAKSAYDEAMSKDDYNAEFKNYQEAYAAAKEMFKNGEFGSHFRDTMEYLLGEDSYTMGIEELEKACKSLDRVFGENAANGYEFLDKLYANRKVLDGLDSSLKKLSDGSYEFDLKPDEFEKIASALGMTTEEVTACTNALGMFGDYRSYDLDELELAMNAISIAASDGKKSVTSLQGVENILKDLGYTGYDTYHILQDIREMGSVKLIDFEEGNVDKIISKLKQLEMIRIDGKNINLDSLIAGMKQLGNSDTDIAGFIARLNGQFNLTDAQGKLVDFETAKKKALSASENEAGEEMSKVGDNAEASAKDVSDLGTEIDKVNGKTLSRVQLQFVNVSTAAKNAENNVRKIIERINALNDTGISVGGSSAENRTPDSPQDKPSGKKGYNGTVGSAFSSGTFDGYKDLPVTGYNGLPQNEKNALRSEYGQPELTVYPDGKTELTTKPTMSDLPKGTVIFNEKQTREIMNGRKKASGNAFASGTVRKYTSKYYSSDPDKKSSPESKSSEKTKKAKKTKKAAEEIFDWIERRIKKFQQRFDKWIKQAETAVTSGFISRYYKKAVSAVKKELSAYGSAYKRYMKQADSIGLSKKYRDKVKDGTIDIQSIRDEKLAEKIKKYQEWCVTYAPLSGNRRRYSI